MRSSQPSEDLKDIFPHRGAAGTQPSSGEVIKPHGVQLASSWVSGHTLLSLPKPPALEGCICSWARYVCPGSPLGLPAESYVGHQISSRSCKCLDPEL